MKISVNWLKTLVDIDVDLATLGHQLTMAGLEVEDISPVAASFSRIVIAEVKSVAPHPNADKLRVTQVDAGQGDLLQIVCGAPNVAVGMRVPCALVGAQLPGLEIKAAKLRGVESNGMLCSARELGTSEDHGGLLALAPDAPIGADIRAYLDLDDVVLTLKITPNRGDCLSMLGIARDLAAVTGKRLKLSNTWTISDENAPNYPASEDFRDVTLGAGEACTRYLGREISGLNTTAVTPEWMKRRLERAGFRSIAPLVDITNYVMFSIGQPMHAFDSAKLTGPVEVRFAHPAETLTLLNGQAVSLTEEMLIIADKSGPLAIAGVMGGAASMVTDQTTAVFFESAFFSPDVVKGKTRTLGLNSDAAFRFERGVNPAACVAAMELATKLALSICGTDATRVGAVTDSALPQATRAPIDFRRAKAESVIGMAITQKVAVEALTSLNCSVSDAGAEILRVTPPTYRFDLSIEVDLIEEIARLVGYEQVPSHAPRSSIPMLPVSEKQKNKWSIRHAAAALGYQEVVNYSFVDPQWEIDFCGNSQPVRIANPIAAQLAVMRTSLIAGLCHTLGGNLDRAETRAKYFEVGRCFLGSDADLSVQPERFGGIAYGNSLDEQWRAAKGAPVDFFSVKGELEHLLEGLELRFERCTHTALHPGRSASIAILLDDGRVERIGVVGELHPRLQQQLDLPMAPVVFELDLQPLIRIPAPHFQAFSRLPAVRRDIAVVVDESIEVGAILTALNRQKSPLVTEIALFDLYRGPGLDPGRKSLAFRIVMQDTERTLTDVECDTVVTQIVEVMSHEFGATLRK